MSTNTQSTPSNLTGRLESILFAAGKPLTLKRLAELTESNAAEVSEALHALQGRYKDTAAGLEVVLGDGEAVMATHPDNSELVRQFLKKEELGELTRPQLETLSVIAYRGPISKAELEQIRGVNCSLILRNLQIRGLVEAIDEEAPVARFQVTVDFLRCLGLKAASELPHFEALSSHVNLENILHAAQS